MIDETFFTEELVRIDVLRPIAMVAQNRAEESEPDSYWTTLGKLTHDLRLQLAAIETHLEPGADPHVAWLRYAFEMPNLLRAIGLARSPSSSTEARVYAVDIAASLMRYFFVTGQNEQGSRVMLSAAHIAKENGLLRKSCALALQAVALARRIDRPELMQAAAQLIDALEPQVVEPSAKADVVLARAMLNVGANDTKDTLEQAYEAYRAYVAGMRGVMRTLRSAQVHADDRQRKLEHWHNDLANSLGHLGMELYDRGRISEARRAFSHSLRHGRGSWIAVNRGQYLHQIGNCDSRLGNRDSAIARYLEAARTFQQIGMAEYLSNALGELGYELLGLDEYRNPLLNVELIEDGLSNLEQDLQTRLIATVPTEEACMSLLRKSSGMLMLATLHGSLSGLPERVSGLHDGVLMPAMRGIIEGRGEGLHFLGHLDVALTAAFMIAELAPLVQDDPLPVDDIHGLLMAVGEHAGGDWALHHLRFSDWLSDVLTKRWAIEGAGREEVKGFFQGCNWEGPEPLQLRRKVRG